MFVGRIADILDPAARCVLGILLIGISWPGFRPDTGRGGVHRPWARPSPSKELPPQPLATRVAVSGFVEVASAGGERTMSLVFREILPNIRATLLTPCWAFASWRRSTW